MKKFLTVITLLLLNVPLFPRDIDLDRIYINADNTIYRQLASAKEKIYSDISSTAVDTKVIYAEWAGGDEIIYIKEYKNVNIVIRYSRDSGKKVEVARFSGTVTSSSLNLTKNSLIVKTLEYTDSGAAAVINFIELRKKSVTRHSSPYFFLDYTMLPGSDSILLYARNGLVRYTPEGYEKETVIKQDLFKSLKPAGEPVLAFISPDSTKRLFITGRGGAYDAMLVTKSSSKGINGITSLSDLCWIDNSRFAYCGGAPGEYTVNIYDTNSGKKTVLVTSTLNPDINFTREPGMLSFLDNQMIVIFSVKEAEKSDTGIEGEEVYFSPDGRKFTSIYRGKLYVTSLNMLCKNRLAVRKNAESIMAIYKSSLNQPGSWLNDYSKSYIEKKYRLYEKFIRSAK